MVVCRGMQEYPENLAEFEAWFSSDVTCRDHLYRLTSPSGFPCPRCANPKALPLGTLLYECSGCHYQLSLIAGSIFQLSNSLDIVAQAASRHGASGP